MQDENNIYYRQKLNQLFKKDINQFIFLFQEKTNPYISRTVDLCNDFITIGAEQAKKALEIYKNNFEKFGFNQWAANQENITTIEYHY
jgi:hypothetical protein